MRPKNGKPLHYADACVLYLGGMSLPQVAERLGSTSPTVLRALRFYDIPTRSQSDGRSLRSRGNRRVDSGYITVCVAKNVRKKEHVLIAEDTLGRRLRKNEVVHHINCKPLDNRRENLLICTRGYHTALHHRMSANTNRRQTNE